MYWKMWLIKTQSSNSTQHCCCSILPCFMWSLSCLPCQLPCIKLVKEKNTNSTTCTRKGHDKTEESQRKDYWGKCCAGDQAVLQAHQPTSNKKVTASVTTLIGVLVTKQTIQWDRLSVNSSGKSEDEQSLCSVSGTFFFLRNFLKELSCLKRCWKMCFTIWFQDFFFMISTIELTLK